MCSTLRWQPVPSCSMVGSQTLLGCLIPCRRHLVTQLCLLLPLPIEVAAASSADERARVALLLGQTLDVPDGYDARAERQLSLGVSLQPDNEAAWAALGHCLMKKGDAEGAELALRESLRLRPTGDAWRTLAQLLRLSGRDSSARLQESIDAATAAVAAEPGSWRNWAGLGTAHLARFSRLRAGDTAHLRKALQAYSQAVRLEAAAAASPAVSAGSSGASCLGHGSDGAAGGSTATTAVAPPGPEVAGSGEVAELLAASRARVDGLPSRTRDPELHLNWATALQQVQDVEGALREFRIVQGLGDPELTPQVRRSRAAVYSSARGSGGGTCDQPGRLPPIPVGRRAALQLCATPLLIPGCCRRLMTTSSCWRARVGWLRPSPPPVARNRSAFSSSRRRVYCRCTAERRPALHCSAVARPCRSPPSAQAQTQACTSF